MTMITIELTQEEYDSVRRYQYDKTVLNSKEYQNCSEILDELFDSVYTQRVEQPT
jgi:hypothetical protein